MATGRCLCGTIRYEYSGDATLITHCHCESCRRQTSSPITTFIIVPKAALRFTQGRPKEFASSPGVARSFCGECGSPILSGRGSMNAIDLCACTLDDPSNLTPQCHVRVEQLPGSKSRTTCRYPHRAGNQPPPRAASLNLALRQFVERLQSRDQCRHLAQRSCWGHRSARVRIGMRFDEHRGDADRQRGACQHRGELAAAGCGALPPGC